MLKDEVQKEIFEEFLDVRAGWRNTWTANLKGEWMQYWCSVEKSTKLKKSDKSGQHLRDSSPDLLLWEEGVRKNEEIWKKKKRKKKKKEKRII